MRRRVFQLVRNILYSLEVCGHVLADLSVAARRAAHKFAVDVFQRNRKSVDFILNHIFRLSDRAFDAAIKLGKLVKGKDILQALERIGMRDLGEPAGCRTADALRRGIRIRVFRMRFLQRAQLALHHIIFVIRNLRCIFVIIFFVVIPQLFT